MGSPQVLEARERLGGRVWSESFSDGALLGDGGVAKVKTWLPKGGGHNTLK